MAQFEPSGSRRGMFDGSCSITEGMADGETVVIGGGAGDEDGDRGAADVDAVARAGPIT